MPARSRILKPLTARSRPLTARARARSPLLAAVAILLALALPATAGASAYTTVYKAFTAKGSIKSCQFSAPFLSAALRETPPYDFQYFAELPDAIQGALNAQAAGVCSKAGTGSLLAGAGAPRSGSGGGPLPTSVRAGTSAGVPFAIVLLGVLAALLAIGGGGYALAAHRGMQSAWLTDWRHACAEAGYRLSGRWADLTDRGRPRRG